MRTLLSQFCEEFEGIVRPVLEPLEQTTRSLSQSGDGRPWHATLPVLRDLRHELDVLADKVAQQQAYVLIFGPLKSGKSTLMNAVAAAYVSEVTSLPAYPCMVYVSHADSLEYQLTDYAGEVSSYTDPVSLRMQISRAHVELVERLREVEARGDEFEPVHHYPQAIRRIDVKVPAGNLEKSGAVLVDTPGLYSRMKFGYDRMTKEFRDSAACAIFIVKSDNLFLEQVFQEFNELLELFSRIFLVVNLDSTKMDLKTDGSLVPSLEQSDPGRIIEAFENLAMSGPLKDAADEGRLRIYPVDLLRAASRRLSGVAEAEHCVGQVAFDSFLTDLTDYLNSTDYLHHFLGDSLRRAESLFDSALEVSDAQSIQELGHRVATLEAEESRVESRLRSLERLASFDWSGAFDELRNDLAQESDARLDSVEDKSAHALDGALDGWFDTDASLAELVDDQLLPVLESSAEEVGLYVRQALDARVAKGLAGLRLPSDIADDLDGAGVDVARAAREGLAGVTHEFSAGEQPPLLAADTIPVKKRLWDWLLFRSAAKVRRKLFGPENRPSVRIPRAQKTKRIGADGKQAMRASLDEHRGQFFPALRERVFADVLGRYGSRTAENLGDDLRASTHVAMEALSGVQKELGALRALQDRFDELDSAVRRGRDELDGLSERYVQTEPGDLIQPFRAPDGQPSPSEALGRGRDKLVEDAPFSLEDAPAIEELAD